MTASSKILVVDDENLIRLNLRALLEDLDFTVIDAANGHLALDLFERESPDLILTDLRMPEFDGLMLITAVREKDPNIPIIAISGTGNIRDAVEAVRRGAWDYITKPVVDNDELEIIIRRVLDRARLLAENRHYQINLEEMVRERTLELQEQTIKLKEEIVARQVAQQALAEEQNQLRRLTETLEQRVREEVDKNREKDRIMFQQSRFAIMGEMLSTIAHQWRQPLNNIGLRIQNLQEEYTTQTLDDQRLDECVRYTMDTIQHMSRTINDFQHYFRPNQEQAVFDIAKATRSAVKLVEPTLHAAGIAVTVDDRDTGSTTGFPNEFTQVLLNIIHNARDILIERHIAQPVIGVICRREGGHLLISIRDNAGGIPPEIMDKIFDPYFSTKPKAQGTGLGLYMSKMIIEKGMGGMLTARNTATGAEFILTMPPSPAA